MRKFQCAVTFLICSSFALLAIAAEELDWREARQEDEITISVSDVTGSKHQAVRAEMTIQATLNALVGLVSDTSACPELAALCKRSNVHERISETELYVYSYNDIPWPVSDRDALAHVTWQQDPTELTVIMLAVPTDGILAETKKAVRIIDGVTSWTFKPLGDGQVNVISQAHIDPRGPVPAWLTNRLLIDAPFETMRSLRTIIQTGRYDDKRFAFISEPQP
ncbi:MAG: hypothetical protein ACI8PP_000459 [Candidatus Pseudothioglobus sp.]|jgi:hypothetical protein